MRLHLIARDMRPHAGWLLGATLLLASCSDQQAPTPTAAGESTQAEGPTPQSAAQPEPATTPPGETPSTTGPAAPPPVIGDVLPLARGVYVVTGTDCAQPANAGLRFYNGRGISGTATHDCHTTVLSRDGDKYRVDQSCIDRPVGDGPRTSEAQTITLHDARSFTLATPDERTRFGLCAQDKAPDYLRERAAQ